MKGIADGANAEGREFDERERILIFLFAVIVFFSFIFWEGEFRCISMIFGKFNVIWWFSGYENILEPVSEMRAFFEPDKISGCQPASNTQTR